MFFSLVISLELLQKSEFDKKIFYLKYIVHKTIDYLK